MGNLAGRLFGKSWPRTIFKREYNVLRRQLSSWQEVYAGGSIIDGDGTVGYLSAQWVYLLLE